MRNEPGKILVIDDDPWMLKIFEQYMSEWGLEILSTDNPYKAVALAVKHQPDLIFLDMVMPSLSGRDVLILLKEIETTRHIPVIMCSAYLDLDNAGTEIMDYASGHINKPISRHSLQSCLTGYLG